MLKRFKLSGFCKIAKCIGFRTNYFVFFGGVGMYIKSKIPRAITSTINTIIILINLETKEAKSLFSFNLLPIAYCHITNIIKKGDKAPPSEINCFYLLQHGGWTNIIAYFKLWIFFNFSESSFNVY